MVGFSGGDEAGIVPRVGTDVFARIDSEKAKLAASGDGGGGGGGGDAGDGGRGGESSAPVSYAVEVSMMEMSMHTVTF